MGGAVEQNLLVFIRRKERKEHKEWVFFLMIHAVAAFATFAFFAAKNLNPPATLRLNRVERADGGAQRGGGDLELGRCARPGKPSNRM